MVGSPGSPRVALVTGGASGIGRAVVRTFVDRGVDVVVVDSDAAGLDAVEAATGALGVLGDVADPAVTERAVALATERLGRLDVAVLNAGIGGSAPLEADDAVERFERLWAVNVLGVVHGLRAAVPAIRATGSGGAVVATASVAAFGGDPRSWAYAASKAAVLNIVQSAAVQYAPEGIRVNAVAPGLTSTGLTAAVSGDTAAREAYAARIPAGRWAEPVEQAEVIWFLASPAAGYMTGAVVPVDGGIHADLVLRPFGSDG